jgi:GNAT superfamily N-acetyltransferase
MRIREASPSDAPALLALERASPEGGLFTIAVEPTVGHFHLAALHSNAQGYVALAPNGETVVGMVFASVAPTQLNGEMVPGLYLSAMRVHPAHRRRGIATALLSHAWEAAREAFGVQVAWGAIGPSNEASLRTCLRAGFTQQRELRARVLFPIPRIWRGDGLAWRRAEADDLHHLAAALNARYAEHQLWRPCSAEDLAGGGTRLEPPPEHTLLGVGPSGEIVAGGSVLAYHRLARLRLLGFRYFPSQLNRALRPLLRRIPLRLALTRRSLLPVERPAAVRAFLQRAQRLSGLGAVVMVILDRNDPAWPLVARYPGLTLPIQMVAQSERTIEPSRPWHFT